MHTTCRTNRILTTTLCEHEQTKRIIYTGMHKFTLACLKPPPSLQFIGRTFSALRMASTSSFPLGLRGWRTWPIAHSGLAQLATTDAYSSDAPSAMTHFYSFYVLILICSLRNFQGLFLPGTKLKSFTTVSWARSQKGLSFSGSQSRAS